MRNSPNAQLAHPTKHLQDSLHHQLIFAERWQARTGTIDDAEPGSGSGSGSGSGATKKELASLRAELKQETSFIQELVVRITRAMLPSASLLLCACCCASEAG